jgi:hypothetical protein
MKGRMLFVVITCFAFLLLATGNAKADTTTTFVVNITSGTLNGDVFTGSFTFNAANVMTSFNFNDPYYDPSAFAGGPNWNDSGAGYAYFQLTDPNDWMVWFNPGTQLLDDSFAFGSADLVPNLFLYGTSSDSGGCSGFSPANCFLGDGNGPVTYNTSAVPEPGTLFLMGTGIASLAASRRKRKTA